jgi:hypothetical protein
MPTDVRQGPEIWIRGPVAVPQAPPPPAPPAGVTPRRYSWVGTHGGAGVTTLALVYGGHDCGRDWPGPGAPRSVLLVGRTHAAGLDSVLRALDAFRYGPVPPGLDLDAVVLVADAPGRLPRPLARRVKAIEEVIDVYRVPWVHDWRLGETAGGPPRETEALTHLTGIGRR